MARAQTSGDEKAARSPGRPRTSPVSGTDGTCVDLVLAIRLQAEAIETIASSSTRS
jgi:hypothetical protein